MWIYSILDREIPVNSYIISEYTWHIDIFYLHYYIILHCYIIVFTCTQRWTGVHLLVFSAGAMAEKDLGCIKKTCSFSDLQCRTFVILKPLVWSIGASQEGEKKGGYAAPAGIFSSFRTQLYYLDRQVLETWDWRACLAWQATKIGRKTRVSGEVRWTEGAHWSLWNGVKGVKIAGNMLNHARTNIKTFQWITLKHWNL